MASIHLARITFDQVRNLAHQTLSLPEKAALFYGANGSGKTSVLEAIHVLAQGRSFRTHLQKSLIRHGSDACLISGRVMVTGHQHALGIRRFRGGGVELRVDGNNAQSFALPASLLPTVVVDTDSLALIAEGPEHRRRFLDGTVFHVEHVFLQVWRRYQRALRQRNAGLRRGTLASDPAWLAELVESGVQLAAIRHKHIGALSRAFAETASALSPTFADVAMELRQGWDAKLSLEQALERSADADRKQGFTHVGPHRADLKLTIGGRPAAEVMSRGQLKLAVVALKLAQAAAIRASKVGQPVLLVDDIAAELDRDHAARVYELLAAGGGQVLLTAVERGEVRELWPNTALDMFHVEQGRVSRASAA